MELPVAIIILLITLIILALAVYLISTIVELRGINAGLGEVLDGVAEIAAKTAPVNGVLDAINVTLATGRDLLEGLAYKKTGGDAAGLVESCFPGEGRKFLQRVGRPGPIVAIGEEYPRGAATLNALLGVAAPAPPAAPAGAPGPSAAVRSGGRISLRKASPPVSTTAAASTAETVPGRISAKGSRPWE